MKLLLSSLDTVFYTFSNSITSQFNFSAISANNCINTVLNGNASRTGMYNALNYLANGLPASSIIGVNNILSMTKIPFQEVFSSDSFADALKEILDGSDFKFNFPQVSLSDFSTAMTFLKLASINSEGDGKTDKNVVKY
jgi:hypothetical protein